MRENSSPEENPDDGIPEIPIKEVLERRKEIPKIGVKSYKRRRPGVRKVTKKKRKRAKKRKRSR